MKKKKLDYFDELTNNSKFINEANEAKKRIASNLNEYTNLTKKYSKIICQ